MFLLPRKRRAVSVNDTPRVDSSTAHEQTIATPPSSGLQQQQQKQQPSQPQSTPDGDALCFPSVTPARTWPCAVCGTHFSTTSNRLRHMRRRHADPSAFQSSASTSGQKRSATAALLGQVEEEEHRTIPGSTFSGEQGELSHVTAAVAAAAAGAQHVDMITAEQTSENALAWSRLGGLQTPKRVSGMVDDGTHRAHASEATSSNSVSVASSTDLDVEPSVDGQELGGASRMDAAEASVGDAEQLSESKRPDTPPHRPLMQDLQLQVACLPFLQWMCQPPVTQVEALVKVSPTTACSMLWQLIIVRATRGC